MNVADGLEILHSTSDILGVEEIDGQLEITLYGDRDMAGEIVFEGVNVKRIKSASIDGDEVKMIGDGKRLAFTYSHKHQEEIILNIKIN